MEATNPKPDSSWKWETMVMMMIMTMWVNEMPQRLQLGKSRCINLRRSWYAVFVRYGARYSVRVILASFSTRMHINALSLDLKSTSKWATCKWNWYDSVNNIALIHVYFCEATGHRLATTQSILSMPTNSLQAYSLDGSTSLTEWRGRRPLKLRRW